MKELKDHTTYFSTKELLKAELLKGDDLLKSFIDEHIPVDELVEIGFLQKEWIGDYRKISDRICQWFGYETIYEYGAKEVHCHLTIGDEDNLIVTDRTDPFVTTIKSVYD